MGYSEAGGNLIYEKNLKPKISWHCPFKFLLCFHQSACLQVDGANELKSWRPLSMLFTTCVKHASQLIYESVWDEGWRTAGGIQDFPL